MAAKYLDLKLPDGIEMFLQSNHTHCGLYFSRVRSNVGKFLAQESGAVAIITALVIPVILLLTAATMDYTNAQRLRTASASALDAALLAAARQVSLGELDEDDIEPFVNEFFEANMVGKNLDAASIGTVSADYNEETGLIAGSVSATSNAVFTRILNPDGVDVGVDSSVTVSLLNVELALVLDVTGSMRGSRLRALQEAANELVDILVPEDGSVGGLADVRVSVVPYSDLVNVGGFEEAITGYSSGESCVHERRGALAFNDTSPFGPLPGAHRDDDGHPNYPPNGNGLRPAKTLVNHPRNFRGYICDNPEILPLTSDSNALSARINEFTAGGWTSGHIGIQWGWYTLSPQFAGVWPADARPVAYNEEETIKVMVVMTDGAFNTWYEPGQGNSFGQGEGLCDAIRNSDIEIYTVGLMTGTSEENFLRDCASSSEHYFDATSRSALVEAFREIGQRLTAVRLAS